MKGLLLISVVLIFSSFVATEEALSGTVYYTSSSNSYTFTSGIVDTNGAAWGYYYDEINSTGWSRLYVHSNVLVADKVQSYAAGFLEGVLTAKRIAQHKINCWSIFFQKTAYDPMAQFFKDQYTWLKSEVNKNSQDPYWKHVSFVLAQLEGLSAGYNSVSSSSMSLVDMYILGSWGDMLDLVNVVNKKERPDFDSMTDHELSRYMGLNGHCSALIKVTGDLSAMFSGHTAWWTYSFMLRIMKHYDLPLNDPYTSSNQVSFSSYPAALASVDDFYITNSGLNVIETSLAVVNMSIYDVITTKSILSWMRVMVANRMANNGKQWVDVFSKYNSGTYNNQWMVVDYKLFEPNAPLKDNLLWIAEQIPGYIQSADKTDVLRFGYWPSYNIPFFPEVRARIGWDSLVTRMPHMAYDFYPRANIFRRDQSKVQELNDIQKILRYNNWQKDSYAMGDPGNQISSRFDLEPTKPDCMGGYDSKAVSHQTIRDMTIMAQSGPTHDLQPVFSWANSPACASNSRVGIPDVMNFGWIEFARV
jgi:hypothetical protein